MDRTGILRTCFLGLLIGIIHHAAPLAAFELVDSREIATGKAADFDYDRFGNIHLVWNNDNQLRYMKGTRQADGSFDFPQPQQCPVIPGSTGAARYRFGLPKIAVDHGGSCHFTWLDVDIQRLYYACYKNGRFTVSTMLKNASPKYYGNCDIEVDRDGRAYICYQNPLRAWPFGIGVICYQPGYGILWERTMQPMDNGEEKNPVFEHNSFEPIDSSNPLYLMWKEVHQYASYNGKSWTAAQSIPGLPQYCGHLDIELDTENRPVVAFVNWIPDSHQWWVEGIYVMTCRNHGDDWNVPIKVNTTHVNDAGDDSPIAPDVAVSPNGDLLVTWNNNGNLKYNAYENAEWFPRERDLSDVNIYACSGSSVIGLDGAVVINENRSTRILFHQFRFNHPPSVLMGGLVRDRVNLEMGGIGGELHCIAVMSDPDGLEDIQSVTAYDPGTGIPVFNLYDDGRHGDYYPGDGIFGAFLSDEYDQSRNPQMICLMAGDSHQYFSDIYPFLTIHGSDPMYTSAPALPVLPSWQNFLSGLDSNGPGDWYVYMAGFMNSAIRPGFTSNITITAWIVPSDGMISAGLDRVELLYEGIPFGRLEPVANLNELGYFYSLTVPIEADDFDFNTGFTWLHLQIRAVDTRGGYSPIWPYLEPSGDKPQIE